MKSVAYLGFGNGGPWGARGARAYNGGLEAEPPAGRAPGRRIRRRSPLEAETLFAPPLDPRYRLALRAIAMSPLCQILNTPLIRLNHTLPNLGPIKLLV